LLPGIISVLLWMGVLVLAMGESALAFASRAKLEELLKQPWRRNRYLLFLERSGPARLACVVGRVACSAALLGILAAYGAHSGWALASRFAAGAAALGAAELLGRFLGKKWSTHVLVALLPPMQLAWHASWPVRHLSRTDAGTPPAQDEQVVDAAIEEIRVAIEDAESEGAIHSDEKSMIEGVLEFENVEVHEIMTPRTEIECIEVNTPLDEAVRIIGEFHHSRIPVYEEVRDRMTGVVHVKDLMRFAAASAEDVSLRDIARKPFFVPETKRALSLLREFKQRHVHIALILDEYGGVTGLITLEDIMEQIVGQLEEGFEAERIEERVRRLGPDAFDVDARLRVEEVNDLLEVSLPEDEDYDTVGGFVTASFARVPAKGEEMQYNGVLIRVLDSDERRVRRLLLKHRQPEGPQERQ